MEIAIKMQEHAAMKHQMQQMQEKILDQEKMDAAFSHLYDAGLLKKLANGQYGVAESYEEHRELIGQKREDGRISKQIEQMMNIQPQFQPSEDRTRTGMQLEAITPYEQE